MTAPAAPAGGKRALVRIFGGGLAVVALAGALGALVVGGHRLLRDDTDQSGRLVLTGTPRLAEKLIGPRPERLTFEDPSADVPLSPEMARARNLAAPIGAAGPAAAAFSLAGVGVVDRAHAADCLAAAIYYEANNQPLAGQRAVAQVVLNRVRHPAFPQTVCGVVFQGSERPTGCQFTFTCDGALVRAPERGGWLRARAVAEQALAGTVEAGAGLATHYHADYVVPYWSASMARLAVIGAHLFYRWTGRWGAPDSYARAYRGGEPWIAWLGGAAANGYDPRVWRAREAAFAAAGITTLANRSSLVAGSTAIANAAPPAAMPVSTARPSLSMDSAATAMAEPRRVVTLGEREVLSRAP